MRIPCDGRSWANPEVVDKLRDAGVNDGLELGGILMTMFDQRTNLGQQVVGEVRNHFEDLVFRSMIPQRPFERSPSFGQSIFEYEPDSNGATPTAILRTK